MKRFLLLSLVFGLPILLVGISVEFYNRNHNTYKAKADYVEKNKDQIELAIFGSSQNWHAINPEYLTIKTAPFAHGGGAMNIDYLVYERFKAELPKLKAIVFEISYQSFERKWNSNWSNNHLFWMYYGINNYDGPVPLSERLLITANPMAYSKKFIQGIRHPERSAYNEFGYMPRNGSLARIKYDTSKIYSTPSLKRRHHKTNLNAYQFNSDLLNKIIHDCIAMKIKVILLSPPKFYIYNRHMEAGKLKRRNSILDNYKNIDQVYIWNYERTFEFKNEWFADPDHLNDEGSKQFSKIFNERVLSLMEDSGINK